MDPHYHLGIPIWKWGLTHPHMKTVNHRFHIWGLRSSGYPFPYGDHRMEMGIDTSPYGND